jgi:hypothetical protein
MPDLCPHLTQRVIGRTTLGGSTLESFTRCPGAPVHPQGCREPEWQKISKTEGPRHQWSFGVHAMQRVSRLGLVLLTQPRQG